MTVTHNFVSSKPDGADDTLIRPSAWNEGHVVSVATAEIDDDAVTNAKQAEMPANTVKMNNTGSTANPIDATLAQFKTWLALTLSDITTALGFTPANKAGDTFTGTVGHTPAVDTSAITASGYSLTGANAQSLVDLAGTWNTSGTPTAIKSNITNTASGSAALLMDLQTGGTSRCKVDKNGTITCANNVIGAGNGIFSSGVLAPYVTNASSTAFLQFGDAANTLNQRNGTNAQSYRLYCTYTDASNYERLAITAAAAADFKIIPEALGTGTLRGLQLGVSSGKLGFYGTTAVTKPTALTGSDGATVDIVYGAEEAGVIANLRTRLGELETKLQALGLLT